MPNRAMLAKNTVYYSVYISPTAELSGSPQRQKKKHIDKPNRSSETQVLDQEIKLQLRLSRVWVSRRNSSLSLSPNVPIPFSHRIDFHSSPTEPPFKCLFLSELSLTTAASKRNEWFLNLWFSSNVRVFLFDHVLQSYCGNLFTWPSSQAPRVDCFIPFFYFQCLAECPALGGIQCIVLKPCFLALESKHLVAQFAHCTNVPGRGGKCWSQAAKREQCLPLTQRHKLAGLREPRGGLPLNLHQDAV